MSEADLLGSPEGRIRPSFSREEQFAAATTELQQNKCFLEQSVHDAFAWPPSVSCVTVVK